MITSDEQAILVQKNRFENEKRGIAKAVRRYLKRKYRTGYFIEIDNRILRSELISYYIPVWKDEVENV